jgi:hypothetical protein
MATDKGRGAGRGRGKGKGKGKGKGENGDGDDGKPQGPGEHEDDSVKRIHEDYVRRHLGGVAPATPEAYERAIEQFNRLPGAMRTPTTARPARPVSKRDDDRSKPVEDKPEKSPK